MGYSPARADFLGGLIHGKQKAIPSPQALQYCALDYDPKSRPTRGDNVCY
jgi:hypothetical protein